MKKNESKLDRLIRAGLTIIFLILAYYLSVGVWSVIFYILAIISAVTALTGFCGLYKILGINTNKSREQK